MISRVKINLFFIEGRENAEKNVDFLCSIESIQYSLKKNEKKILFLLKMNKKYLQIKKSKHIVKQRKRILNIQSGDMFYERMAYILGSKHKKVGIVRNICKNVENAAITLLRTERSCGNGNPFRGRKHSSGRRGAVDLSWRFSDNQCYGEIYH